MRSTVAMMLAPGCRKMMTMIDGLPSERPKFRMSSTESVTVATSLTRTGAPLRQATISGSYSAAVINWSVAVIDHERRLLEICPLGRLALAAGGGERTAGGVQAQAEGIAYRGIVVAADAGGRASADAYSGDPLDLRDLLLQNR